MSLSEELRVYYNSEENDYECSNTQFTLLNFKNKNKNFQVFWMKKQVIGGRSRGQKSDFTVILNILA